MTKQEFMAKHDFNDLDYRNLIRYEEVRRSGIFNMYEYLELMKRINLNGGKRLADWIEKAGNYEEFLSTLGKEKENEISI